MALRLTAVIAFAATLFVGAQAQAAQSRRITLQIGDVFIVAGTDIACQTQVGKNVIKGQKLVTCFKLKSGALKAGSYIAALGANGRVVVAPIKAGGNIGAPVFDRKPADLRAGTKQIIAHVGDQMLLSGTNLACSVNNDASGVYPTCFLVTNKGGVPGSLAFAETEKFVAIVRFDASGKKTKLVFKRAQ